MKQKHQPGHGLLTVLQQQYGMPPATLQRSEAILRRDQGEESLAEIGRSYNVSAATISRLYPPHVEEASTHGFSRGPKYARTA